MQHEQSEREISCTVRKIFTDCSNLIAHLSNAPEDELSGGSLSLPLPFPPSPGEVFAGNDSSTTTFSSFSFKTVARTRHDFLDYHILKGN